MLEIGPNILRFYLSYIIFFKAIFNFLSMWSACGLLKNKRYINKLLLLLFSLNGFTILNPIEEKWIMLTASLI